MKITKMKLALLSLSLAAVPAAFVACTNSDAQTPSFSLTSPDLSNGTFTTRFILNGFGCTGQNVSPVLVWSGVPAGTKSQHVTVLERGVPTGEDSLEWGV